MNPINVEKYSDELTSVQMKWVFDMTEEQVLKGIDANTISTIDGVKIVHWDEMVFAQGGMRGDIVGGVMANATLNVIIINTATLSLPKHILDAIIAHELGHIHYEHEEINIEFEMQADKYSYDKGYDITSALEMLAVPLQQFVDVGLAPPDTVSMIHQRINVLRTL